MAPPMGLTGGNTAGAEETGTHTVEMEGAADGTGQQQQQQQQQQIKLTSQKIAGPGQESK